MENLVESLINLFYGLGKEVVVFIISMLPLLELRGGLLAASLLKLDFLPGYIISIIGNTLPIPIVLLFLEYKFLISLSTSSGFSNLTTLAPKFSKILKLFASFAYLIQEIFKKSSPRNIL